MAAEDVKRLKEKLLLFIVSPFMALIYSLQDVKSRSSYLVFFMFCILFGWMFVAEYEPEDSFRYRQRFLEFAVMPDLHLKTTLEDYLTSGSEVKDVYCSFLYWISAKIGGLNYHYFFMLGAVFFSFFFLKSMRIITNHQNFDVGWAGIVLIFLFAYSNPIYNINGIRFCTASWVAVYAIFKLLVDRNVWYLPLFLVLPLIHLTMPIVWALFLLCWLLRNQYKLLVPAMIASLFISSVILVLVDYVFPYFTSGPIQQLLWGYTQSEYALDRMNQSPPLYAQILSYLPILFQFLMTSILVKEKKNITSSRSVEILGFYLAFYTLTNFLDAIPSAGRYCALSIPLLIYVWVDNYTVLKKYNKYALLIPVVYAYSIFLFWRRLYEASDSALYWTPLPYQIFQNL